MYGGGRLEKKNFIFYFYLNLILGFSYLVHELYFYVSMSYQVHEIMAFFLFSPIYFCV